MDKIFNITSNFKSVTTEKGVNISGLASATATDRAGDIIPAEAWMKGGLQDFKKNPIILFNHNYGKPIGKATNIEPSDEGLKMDAFISAAAPDGVAELIKDGVLGAFSVGFRIKDADYIEETGGLLIKDAELFEVSVVSVPCNQDATFSIAKSFDSENEYEDFKKTFTNSVNLAGQSLAKEEENSSNIASGAPDGGNTPQTEIQMTPEELAKFAKDVAEKAAKEVTEKLALAQAVKDAELKTKADAATKAAADALNSEEAVKTSIANGIQSGTEKLLADVEAKLAEKDANIAEVIKGFQADLEEKSEEIKAIRNSKRVFADRKGEEGISAFGEEFMQANLMGVMLGKGWNTKFAQEIAEKAGIDYTTGGTELDREIGNRIEKEVQMYTDVSKLFQQIPVNGKHTVLPIQPDVGPAQWAQTAVEAGNLESRLANAQVPGANTFGPGEVVMSVYRLISQTYMDNEVDEEILVSLMPMIVDSVARAHALAVDEMCIVGNGGTIDGLVNATKSTAAAGTLASGALQAQHLFNARKVMGKYGVKPSDVVYIVSLLEYFSLINDPDFEDVQQVGAVANKVTGSVGSVYGSAVVVSDSFAAPGASVPLALAVNTRSFAIPRLRSMTVEQDYEVAAQRKVIVGAQSLGFTKLIADYANNRSAVRILQDA